MMDPGSGESGRLVLIVDDDLDIRETLAETLSDHGFEVATAANGLEALTLLRGSTVRPSVILLDLMMPIMDGYGFVDQQRMEDPRIASIPVAIITAAHGVDQARLGERLPIVTKPIKVPQLMNLLRQLQTSA